MGSALHINAATMPSFAALGGACVLPAVRVLPRPLDVTAPARSFYILGITADGRRFRPSDWAERLAGAMSCFRPGGASSRLSDRIGYSPYCEPRTVDGNPAVLVSGALRAAEPMAWDFVTNFARDNGLQTRDV